MINSAFILILLMLSLGVWLRRARLLPENAGETLNQIVLSVCLPAAVLRFVPRLELNASVLHVALIPWLLLALNVALVAVVARAMRLQRAEHAALLLCVSLGNTSFLGYPLVVALLGETALPYAVIYDQFGAFLILSSVGLFVVARFGGETPPSARQILARVVRFPPLWALVLGLTVMPAAPPAPIAEILQRLSDAMLPMAMLAIGLSVRFWLPRGELKVLGVGLFLKLVLVPGMAVLLVRLLGLEGLEGRAAVLESAMPPMISAAALAIAHRLAPRLAAALVGYGIPISLLSVPAWARLLDYLG